MPQHNGISKGIQRTLMEKDRFMLRDVVPSQDYWLEVVDTSCYVVNRSSMLDLVEKTPYEAWASKRPSLAHINIFGCDTFVHIPK